MSKVKTHKDLDVWKEAMTLARKVYSLTKGFPKEENFGLASQMRRAAVSIPSNIAEGAARDSRKEFIRFLYLALGSAAEIETQMLLSRGLNFTDNIEVEKAIERVGRMLNALIKALKKHDVTNS